MIVPPLAVRPTALLQTYFFFYFLVRPSFGFLFFLCAIWTGHTSPSVRPHFWKTLADSTAFGVGLGTTMHLCGLWTNWVRGKKKLFLFFDFLFSFFGFWIRETEHVLSAKCMARLWEGGSTFFCTPHIFLNTTLFLLALLCLLLERSYQF